MDKVKNYAIFGLAVAFALALLWIFYGPKPTAPQVGEYGKAVDVKGTEDIQRKDVPVPTVKALDKKEVVKKLPDLPPAVIVDPTKEITALGTIEPWSADTTVAAVVNTVDGSTELYFQPQPEPFAIWAERPWYLRIEGSLGSLDTFGDEWQIELEYKPVSFSFVGDSRISPYLKASLDSEKEAKAVAGAEVNL